MDLEKLLAIGQIPQDIDESMLKQLEDLIKHISDAQKLNERGASEEEILSSMASSEKMTLVNIEKGLALYKFIVQNKESLNQIISSGKRKQSKFRQSGHLTDQTLKYKEPTKNQQLTIFDLLTSETKEKIQESKIEIKAEGVRLSPPEDRILKALNKLLHEKNDIPIDPEENYANIDANFPICPYGGKGKTARAPILRISPAELYKSYLDRDDYSGEEIKYIKKTLYDLSQKRFLIIYDRKRKENGKPVTDRIEDYQNLIKIMSYIEGLSEGELKKLNAGDQEIREKRGELIIGLNPIFIDQINTKYVEFPVDINRRTTIAAGGHNCVTEAMIILRDYMLREISAKRFRVEINEDRLPYLLNLEGYIKRRKKKIMAERIVDAINTVKNLGIILDHKVVIGASGQQKYVFNLNQNFE